MNAEIPFANQTEDNAAAVTTEDLIEEVSIDGMCGVY